MNQISLTFDDESRILQGIGGNLVLRHTVHCFPLNYRDIANSKLGFVLLLMEENSNNSITREGLELTTVTSVKRCATTLRQSQLLTYTIVFLST